MLLLAEKYGFNAETMFVLHPISKRLIENATFRDSFARELAEIRASCQLGELLLLYQVSAGAVPSDT